MIYNQSLHVDNAQLPKYKADVGSDPTNPIQCGAGTPCLDGSCCSRDGKCGFRDYHCGAKCISNCNAKAMCGVNSPAGSKKCGLNLCCSYYGWCGVCKPACKDTLFLLADFSLGR